MPQGRAITAFNLVMLAVGGVALAVILDHIGWVGIRRAVVGTGWLFAVIGACDLGSAMCDAFAIKSFMRRDVGFWRVFLAQISGMAINRVTPGHTLGEPVKVTTLARWVPVDVAVPAIVTFNLMLIYVGTVAIAIGVPITVATLDVPDRVALVAWIAMGFLIALAVALAIVVRRGAVGSLIGALVAVRIVSAERGERWRTKMADVDARMRNVSLRGVAAVLVSRVFNWIGTIVVLVAADIPLTPPLVIASLTVGIMVTWISQIIPLGLGIADGSNYVLYGLLGASAEAGLLFTMINRLRTCLIAGIGLIVMASVNVIRRFVSPQ